MVWQKQINTNGSNDHLKSIKNDILHMEKTKETPRQGSKVRAIANIFQSMSPNIASNQFKKLNEANKLNSTNSNKSNEILNASISRRNIGKTFPSELDVQQKQISSVKNNLINLNRVKDQPNENGKENDKSLKKTPVQDNRKIRTESRVNRFNNAKAIFEKMESNGAQTTTTTNGTASLINKFNNNGKLSPSKEKNAFLKETSLNETSPAKNKNSKASKTDLHNVISQNIKNNQLNDEHNWKKDCSNDKTLNGSTNHQIINTNEVEKQIRSKNSVSSPPAATQNIQKSKDELIDKVFSELASNSQQDISMDFRKLINNSQNCLYQKSDVNLSDICDTSGITEILDRFENSCKYDDVDLMTEEEANKLLCKPFSDQQPGSTSNSTPSSPVKQVNKIDSIKSQFESDCQKVNGNYQSPSFLQKANEEKITNNIPNNQAEEVTNNNNLNERIVEINDVEYHIFKDGNFYFEKEEMNNEDEDYNQDLYRKVRFNTKKVKVYSTYTLEEYDRKNDEVDPLSASASYELEKRIEKMDVFPVELNKGSDDLGMSILGMGVGADSGLEKLGIFIKAITPNGSAEKDGRIQVNDQIIEVDGNSLVGVTQEYASSVLKSCSGTVNFLIGREKDPKNSEIARLIQQSLDDEKQKELYDVNNCFNNPCFYEAPNKSLPDSPEPEGNLIFDQNSMDSRNGFSSKGFGNHDFSDTLDDDQKVADLKLELNNWINKYNLLNSQLVDLKEKMGNKCKEMQTDLEITNQQLIEFENDNLAKKIELEETQKLLNETKAQYQMQEEKYTILEKKYHKAKKLIKGFQQRENGKKEQEPDVELYALITTLKERILILERQIIELQKASNLPSKNESSCINEIVYELLNKNTEEKSNKRMSLILQQLLLDSPDDLNQAFLASDQLDDLDSNDESNDTSDDLNHLISNEILNSKIAKDKAKIFSSLNHNRKPSSNRRSSNSLSES